LPLERTHQAGTILGPYAYAASAASPNGVKVARRSDTSESRVRGVAREWVHDHPPGTRPLARRV